MQFLMLECRNSKGGCAYTLGQRVATFQESSKPWGIFFMVEKKENMKNMHNISKVVASEPQ